MNFFEKISESKLSNLKMSILKMSNAGLIKKSKAKNVFLGSGGFHYSKLFKSSQRHGKRHSLRSWPCPARIFDLTLEFLIKFEGMKILSIESFI